MKRKLNHQGSISSSLHVIFPSIIRASTSDCLTARYSMFCRLGAVFLGPYPNTASPTAKSSQPFRALWLSGYARLGLVVCWSITQLAHAYDPDVVSFPIAMLRVWPSGPGLQSLVFRVRPSPLVRHFRILAHHGVLAMMPMMPMMPMIVFDSI